MEVWKGLACAKLRVRHCGMVVRRMLLAEDGLMQVAMEGKGGEVMQNRWIGLGGGQIADAASLIIIFNGGLSTILRQISDYYNAKMTFG